MTGFILPSQQYNSLGFIFAIKYSSYAEATLSLHKIIDTLSKCCSRTDSSRLWVMVLCRRPPPPTSQTDTPLVAEKTIRV